jgi:hypothetical protein
MKWRSMFTVCVVIGVERGVARTLPYSYGVKLHLKEPGATLLHSPVPDWHGVLSTPRRAGSHA